MQQFLSLFDYNAVFISARNYIDRFYHQSRRLSLRDDTNLSSINYNALIRSNAASVFSYVPNAVNLK